MAPDDDAPKSDRRDEPTVRELLDGASLDSVVDATTQAELAKWFALPSVEVAREQGMDLPEDPELVAMREARARALAAVDPHILATVNRRIDDNTEAMIMFNAIIDIHIKTEMGCFDYSAVERQAFAIEPREREVDEDLRDEMKEVAPQALLRDLHRPEDEFEKQFEMVDPSAAQRYDIVAEVAGAMRTNWRLPPLPDITPLEEERRLLAGDRAMRRRAWWTEVRMPNRKVSE
ncbi:MAG TPA: hypothetical protein VH143_19510 [Kofleriaceae bacterium]|jgi:hypothetical protein|nr:hypothetical protein [Kofleriaceae bacterium]